MLLRLLAPLTVAAFTLFATAAMGAGEPQFRMPVRIVDVRGATSLVSRGAAVLDVRSKAEFHGATPNGEARGGHVAGAQHLDWRVLLDEGGRVVSSARLARTLSDLGVDPAGEIITCCSCGVRSAFVATALLSRGVTRVRNYDGSMAEWSDDPSRPMAR